MKKFIKLFEEHIIEAGAAIESPRPNTNGNYALATAQDFHISEIMGEFDEAFDRQYGNDEKAKTAARTSVANILSHATDEWAKTGVLPAEHHERLVRMGIRKNFEILDAELKKHFGKKEESKKAARMQIRSVWDKALRDWKNGNY